jgi:hypothetical protein
MFFCYSLDDFIIQMIYICWDVERIQNDMINKIKLDIFNFDLILSTIINANIFS